MRSVVLLLVTVAVAHASVTVTRTSNDGPHPSTMEIEVQLPYTNRQVRIPLTKTNAFENVPMTVMKDGVSRTFSASQVHHPSHAHYRDIDSRSVISVRHVNGKRQISGHVMHEGTSYFLEPVGDSGHRVTRNIAKPELAEQIDRKQKIQTRRKRQTLYTSPKTNVVEILLLLDHTVYNAFKGIYVTDDKVLTELHYYYTHILNGVDTVFRNIGTPSISISCIGLVIATTEADAAWLPAPGSVADPTQASDILASMMKWSVGKGGDHVMAFTRTDIKSGTNSAVCGMAYTSGACKDSRQSINEDQGMHSWGTAAHELAHNLASEHDADSNTCSTDDKFLMSPKAGSYDLTNVGKSYKFSPCTISYIQGYITQLGAGSCLKVKSGTQFLNLAKTEREGTRMTLDQVCKLSYPTSIGKLFIQEDTAVNPALICAKVFCVPGSDANQGATTGGLRAPVGTPCGNQKSCNWQGQCTADTAAPVANEACFFGDLWGGDCPGWAGYIDSLTPGSADAKQQCNDNKLKIYCCQSIGNKCSV